MPPVENLSINASYVRQNWSTTIDSVVHEKPAFIKRTHDNITMMDTRLLQYMLMGLQIHVFFEPEDDGSITGGVEEFNLYENAPTKDECLNALIDSIRGFSEDFYNDFEAWGNAPNLKPLIPYVFKVLSTDNEMLRKSIVCQDGRN